MDAALSVPKCPRGQPLGLMMTALAPVVPQILGSVFNIWYNRNVVTPLLTSEALKNRFEQTIIIFNAVAYPIAIFAWLWLVYSLRGPFRKLCAGDSLPDEQLAPLRRRVINLPWWGALIAGSAWLLCIPVFLLSLADVGGSLDPLLMWHLPISILVSALIAMTHSIFAIELASHWGLYPVFFRDSRADLIPGGLALSLRGRGVLWAVSAGICPIGSLLMLSFAPPAPTSNPQAFAVYVGVVGIVFGLLTAYLISRLVAKPVDHLRTAAKAVAGGRLDVQVALPRADEFGLLAAEFNHMVKQLKEKERLRQTFGLHVGRAAATQILARDPGLNGVEQKISVMFVDIRSFTMRASTQSPPEIVRDLNQFLGAMVQVVEDRHGGMINKFLGDGFMALFGVGQNGGSHAKKAVAAGEEILRVLEELNSTMRVEGREAFRIGIGVHTGPAVVGSVGSPERLEFTAIGNTINIAARVEQLTKILSASFLITAATANELQDRASFRDLGHHEIRGLEEKVNVYEVVATNH
jgi:adenylate cyclase